MEDVYFIGDSVEVTDFKFQCKSNEKGKIRGMDGQTSKRKTKQTFKLLCSNGRGQALLERKKHTLLLDSMQMLD